MLQLIAGISCIPIRPSIDPGFTMGKNPTGTGNCEVRSCGDEADVFAGAVDSDDGMKGMQFSTEQN